MSAGLYSGVSGLALGIGLYRNVSGLWGGASGLIDGFGGADPYAGASLYLNFLNPVLDPRIDFSRGTNATLTDSTGKLTYAPNNLLVQSQNFTDAAWVSSNTPIRTSGQIDPNGGTTATKLDLDVNDGIYQFAGSRTGNYVFSIWVRGDAAGTIRLSDASGGAFDVVVDVTTAWTRVSTGSRAISGFFSPYIYRGAGNLSTVYVAFAQLEQVTYQTTPSTYVATTASAYYGPRFDYDPVTLAPRGLLIEEARTNLLTYSEQFDNAAWVKGGATVTANVTASPDGTNNADKLVETATTGVHEISQAGGVTSGTTYVYSVFAKQGERNRLRIQMDAGRFPGTALAFFDLVTGAPFGVGAGATAFMTNCGNGWFRCILVSAATVSGAASTYSTLVSTGTTFSYTGDGTSGLYLYGAQLEAGSFATSYIPTIASTVTRNADVATMTGTNFSSWFNASQGSLLAEFSSFRTTAVSGIVAEINDGTSNNRYALVHNATSTDRFLTFIGGAAVVTTLDYTAVGVNAIGKWVASYQVGNYGACLNGAAPLTSTYGSLPAGLSTLAIGNASGGSFINGHIRTIAYFNTRLPNAQLQTLTAPSLATTLSLDFTSGSYNVGF